MICHSFLIWPFEQGKPRSCSSAVKMLPRITNWKWQHSMKASRRPDSEMVALNLMILFLRKWQYSRPRGLMARKLNCKRMPIRRSYRRLSQVKKMPWKWWLVQMLSQMLSKLDPNHSIRCCCSSFRDRTKIRGSLSLHRLKWAFLWAFRSTSSCRLPSFSRRSSPNSKS